MPTTAFTDGYHGEMRDKVENFNGQQIFNISWDQHLMLATPLCIPVDPEMKFGDMVNGVLPGTFGKHPDFDKIDWDRVEWLLNSEPFDPDFDKSFKDNGIVHKALVRFRTPELTGLNGTHN